ncbi:MAG: hypothetical protein ACYC26_07310 [Phycisphaerales bacterium]
MNDPKNEIGPQRYKLYRCAHERIAEAIKKGFYLEAIALSESIISDRLEARRAWRNEQTPKAREFGTVGRLAANRMGDLKEPPEMKEICKEVQAWAKTRNIALHQIVKVAEGDSTPWEVRYENAKRSAIDGLRLCKRVSNIVQRLNKPTTGATAR